MDGDPTTQALISAAAAARTSPQEETAVRFCMSQLMSFSRTAFLFLEAEQVLVLDTLNERLMRYRICILRLISAGMCSA